MPATDVTAPIWWIRPGLEPVDRRLTIAGRDAEQIGQRLLHGLLQRLLALGQRSVEVEGNQFLHALGL